MLFRFMNSFHTLFLAPYNKQYPVFAFVRFAYWKLIRLLKWKDVKYRLWDNRVIFLNYDSFQSMWIMYNYFVDWEEFNLIKNYVKSDNTLFDIGTNMGFYTIWMSQFIGKGKIHAFEPDSGNFERLQKNIALNYLQNQVTINQSAASDKDGIVSFTSGLDGENHIADSTLKNTVPIQSQKIDSYIQQHSITSSIAYMKVDVEGFEYAVLKGSETALRTKQIDIIQLEINKTIVNSEKNIEDLLDLINEYQYQLCSYDVNNNQLKAIMFSPERENYFAVNDLNSINIKLKAV
jgi:FkbM family methyltransferase